MGELFRRRRGFMAAALCAALAWLLLCACPGALGEGDLQQGVASCASGEQLRLAFEDASIHTIKLSADIVITDTIHLTLERAVLVDMGDYSISMAMFCGMVIDGPITFRGSGATAPLITVGFRQFLLLKGGVIEATADGARALLIESGAKLTDEWLTIRASGANAVGVDCAGSATLAYLDIAVSGENSIGVRAEGNITIGLSKITAEGCSLYSSAGEIRAYNCLYSATSAPVTQKPLRAVTQNIFIEAGAAFMPDEAHDRVDFIGEGIELVYSNSIIPWNMSGVDLSRKGIYPMTGIIGLPIYDLAPEGISPYTALIHVYDPSKLTIFPITYTRGRDMAQIDLLINTYPQQELTDIEVWYSSNGGGGWARHNEIDAYFDYGLHGSVELLDFPISLTGETLIYIKAALQGNDCFSNIAHVSLTGDILWINPGGDRNGLDRFTEGQEPGTANPTPPVSPPPPWVGDETAPTSPDTDSAGLSAASAPVAPEAQPPDTRPDTQPTAEKKPSENGNMAAGGSAFQEPAPSSPPPQKPGEALGGLEHAVTYQPALLIDMMNANPNRLTFIQQGISLSVRTEAFSSLIEGSGGPFTLLMHAGEGGMLIIRAFAGERALTGLEGERFLVTIPGEHNARMQVCLIASNGQSYEAEILEDGRVQVWLDCFGEFTVTALTPTLERDDASAAYAQQPGAQQADTPEPTLIAALAACLLMFAAGLTAWLRVRSRSR